MTRRANKWFLASGAACAALGLAVGYGRQAIGPELADLLVHALLPAAFLLLVILGIFPWMASLAMRHPIHNTQDYRPDFAPQPEKEAGPFPSQGWRRRSERGGLLFLSATGLFIEPDRKG